MAQGVAFMTVLDLEQTARETGDSAAKAWLRALAATAPIAVHPQRTLPAVIEELGRHYGEAPALVSAHESFTYAQLAERANRYARWALALGLAKRDTVCLLMPNRPEYLAIWLGVTRIGGIVSLLNTRLTGAAISKARALTSPARRASGRTAADTKDSRASRMRSPANPAHRSRARSCAM